MTVKSLKITKPDDWHVHLREGNLLKAVINYSTRVNQRCIVMPNLNDPITTTLKGIDYIKKSIYFQIIILPLYCHVI